MSIFIPCTGNIMALRPVLRPHTRHISPFNLIYAIWTAILASNRNSRRILIHTQRATACSVCLILPRYLVLLFLVWKQYWKIVASTLFRFFLSSKGIDSISLRTLDFSICSVPKYLHDVLPSSLVIFIFHFSSPTGVAWITSPVCLSVTWRLWSSVRFSS